MYKKNVHTLSFSISNNKKIPDLFPPGWEGELDRDKWPHYGVPSCSHLRIHKDEREKRIGIEEDEWKMEEDDRLNREPEK